MEGEHTAESLGERLRRLRTERGFSQRELSSPGVSYAYVSRIEAGARQPSVKALRKLAPKLGVSVEYLETGTDVRKEELRELRLSEAELKLRLDLDPEAAASDFRAVLAEADEAGDEDAGLRARLGLGEAAARRGSYAEAVEQLEEPLLDPRISPLSHGDVFATLARSYSALGRPERAVELLSAAWPRCASALPRTSRPKCGSRRI